MYLAMLQLLKESIFLIQEQLFLSKMAVLCMGAQFQQLKETISLIQEQLFSSKMVVRWELTY